MRKTLTRTTGRSRFARSALVVPPVDYGVVPRPSYNVGAATGSGVSDHGALSGLGDDDHAQYLLADGTRFVAGNLRPDVSGGRSLGSSGYQWSALWARAVDLSTRVKIDAISPSIYAVTLTVDPTATAIGEHNVLNLIALAPSALQATFGVGIEFWAGVSGAPPPTQVALFEAQRGATDADWSFCIHLYDGVSLFEACEFTNDGSLALPGDLDVDGAATIGTLSGYVIATAGLLSGQTGVPYTDLTYTGLTAGQVLRATGANAAAFSTATYPNTVTVNRLLYASAANVISDLATGNSGVLVTDGSGVPSIATNIPTAVTIGGSYIYRAGGTDVPVADGGTNKSAWTQYAIPYLSAATTFGEIAIGAAGKVLAVAAGATGYEWISVVAGGGAPIGAQYVVLVADGDLTSERVLTGTANQITITDNGAGSTVVLSLPQNIHTAATPQFARLGLGAAADASALLFGSGGSPVWWLKDTSSGDSALSRTMQAILLTSAAMNATSKYTPAILFGSTDPDFTTENPKVLAALAGRATEGYVGDTRGGMALDFATTPNNPGANSVPVVNLTLTESGNLAVNAGKGIYFDGAGVVDGSLGDTRILESSANVMDLYAGGVNALRLTATAVAVTGTFSSTGEITGGTTHTFIVMLAGTQAVDSTAPGALGAGFLIPFNCTILEIRANAGVAPTGANLVFDVHYDSSGGADGGGTSIWYLTPANRLTITAGNNTASTTAFDTDDLVEGGTLEFYRDLVGSTVAGKNVCIALTVRKTAAVS